MQDGVGIDLTIAIIASMILIFSIMLVRDRPGQLFEQPVVPSQRQALLLRQAAIWNNKDQLNRLLLRHIVQCRHHGTSLAEHRSACQCRKHR